MHDILLFLFDYYCWKLCSRIDIIVYRNGKNEDVQSNNFYYLLPLISAIGFFQRKYKHKAIKQDDYVYRYSCKIPILVLLFKKVDEK